MTDRSTPLSRQPATQLSMAALADVLVERFGPAIAAAVSAQLEAEHRQQRGGIAAEAVRRAVEMASEAELALAGTGFVEHLALSALNDGPDFQVAARSAGVRSDGLGIEQRLRIDAAFVSTWRERQRGNPRFGGREAALALMTEVLQRAA